MQEVNKIAALVLNYRDAVRTLICVYSLLENGVGYILIWDNSEDNGESARLLDEKLQSDKRIDIIISPCNVGFASGVNLGIEKIRLYHPDSFLLLMNNDAVMPPGTLQKLITAFQNEKNLLIAYPSIKQQCDFIESTYYNRWSGILSRRQLPGSFCYPSGCCLLVSLKKLDFKLFDESFFMYGEDIELGFRLMPHTAMQVSGAMVIHEGSASSGLGSIFYENRMAAAHWLLAQKLARNKWEKFVFYSIRCLLLPIRGLIRSLRFKSLAPLKALYEGWRIAHGHDPVRSRLVTHFEGLS